MSATPEASRESCLEIETPAPFQWGALLFCLLALGLLALAGSVNKHGDVIAWLSLGPALCAVALVLTRQTGFAAVCHETALEMTRPYEMVLPWHKILALIPVDRKPKDPSQPARSNYRIRVIHAEGTFEIPRTTNLPSDQVLHFFLQHIPKSGSRDLPQPLLGYLQQCLAQFGEDQVLSYRSRRDLSVPWYTRKRFVMVGLALLLTGIIWVTTGKEPLMVAAFGAFEIALILLLLSVPWSLYPLGTRKAGLILTPHGLGIYQKPYFGYADWHEITAVRLGRPHGDLFDIGRKAINLSIEDQQLPIYDVYDRPALTIYRQILEYWQNAPAVLAAAQEYPQTQSI